MHVVYGGAHLFRAGTAKRFGELALKSLDEYAPNFVGLCQSVSLPDATGLPDSAEAAEAIAKSIEADPETARRENRPAWFAHTVYRRVREKLQREPVEDFRIDFEDGYGNRPDEEEDGHAAAAADELSAGMNAGELPPFIGIRIKPLTEELRARSIRTLDIFLTAARLRNRAANCRDISASRCRRWRCRMKSPRLPISARAWNRCSISSRARCASS